MTIIEVDICHRMGPLRMMYSVTLTSIFKVTLFKWLLWQVNAWKCIHYHCYQIGSQYLPSNDATATVVDHDLGLHFQGYEFWNMNIPKTLRASKKCSNTTFIKVHICYRVGTLSMLYSVTLTFILKFKHFFVMHLQKKNSQAANVHGRFASNSPHREVILVRLCHIRQCLQAVLLPYRPYLLLIIGQG